ncbi:hypothetical protein T492DRAFT_894413 [Pavlovales sp. CCMP2436]|nr:hypothetical protein T492DRAFT_894413 [Pavlovales sp. CCMP2436]
MSEGCGRVTDGRKVCDVCRYRANKDKACATEGCGRVSYMQKFCNVCRYRANKDKACATEGCKHKPGCHERCIAGKCPDTGHIFDDSSPDRMMRKSPDRIDNAKGYEPGNVRVTTWRANYDRGNTPLDQWLPKVAERYKL